MVKMGVRVQGKRKAINIGMAGIRILGEVRKNGKHS
jgi:hypothetical protein